MTRHKNRKISKLKLMVSLFLVGAIAFQSLALVAASKPARASERPAGAVKRVIVGFKGKAATAEELNARANQIDELVLRRGWLAGVLELSRGYKKITREYSHLPYVAMDVDAEGEASLKANPNVTSVVENEFLRPLALDFATTPGVLDGDWEDGFSDGTSNYTGDGFAVAILDDGVDKTHPNLAGTVISEACYGANQEYTDAIIESACPGGATATTAAGSGVPCALDCNHGTSVGSMVAMQSTAGLMSGSDPVEASGVARDAKLIAIQVSLKITEKAGQGDICGDAGEETEVCYKPDSSLILAGLNRVLELQDGVGGAAIAAANVSIGGGAYSDEAQCVAASSVYNSINQSAAALKSANIATIVAAGNEGDVLSNANKIAAPACLSNVIAVSATTADDHMTTYTNAGPLTDLVAPGGEADPGAPHSDGGLFAAQPGDTLAEQYAPVQGTSFSAPITAGAWAVIREKNPDASVDGILEGLQDNGVNVTEDRSGYTALTHKRIDIGATLAVADDLQIQADGTGDGDDPDVTTASDTTWTPGVPNAGDSLSKLRSVGIMGICILLLYLMYRGNVSKVVHRCA